MGPWALDQDLTRYNYSFRLWVTAIFSLKVRMKTSRKPVIGIGCWEDYDLTLKHFSYLQIAVCRDISSQAFKISNDRDLITFSGLRRIIWEDINGINSIKERDKHIGKLRTILGYGTISQDINLGWKEIIWGRTIFYWKTSRKLGCWLLTLFLFMFYRNIPWIQRTRR